MKSRGSLHLPDPSKNTGLKFWREIAGRWRFLCAPVRVESELPCGEINSRTTTRSIDLDEQFTQHESISKISQASAGSSFVAKSQFLLGYEVAAEAATSKSIYEMASI